MARVKSAAGSLLRITSAASKYFSLSISELIVSVLSGAGILFFKFSRNPPHVGGLLPSTADKHPAEAPAPKKTIQRRDASSSIREIGQSIMLTLQDLHKGFSQLS